MIFISYSSLDEERTQALRARLEADGLSCWMAPDDIRIGQDYASEIPAAIANCHVFLLLLTDNAQKSIWVPKELDTAINLGKPIVPYLAEGMTMAPAFWFKLVNVQAILATGDDARDYVKLTKALRLRLPPTGDEPSAPTEAEASVQPADKTTEASAPPRDVQQISVPVPARKKTGRKLLWVALLLFLCAALACAGIFAAKLVESPSQPEVISSDRYRLRVNADNTCTIVEYVDKTIKSLTIPDYIEGYKVTGIGELAFYNCCLLSSVDFPAGLAEIEPRAFVNCVSLTTLEFPSGLHSIGVSAFKYCEDLKEVCLPDHLTYYSVYAFSSSTNVIVIKDTTTADTIQNLDDGWALPKTVVFAEACIWCHCCGDCRSCNGTGLMEDLQSSGVCIFCAGTGVCPGCGGKGYMMP